MLSFAWQLNDDDDNGGGGDDGDEDEDDCLLVLAFSIILVLWDEATRDDVCSPERNAGLSSSRINRHPSFTPSAPNRYVRMPKQVIAIFALDLTRIARSTLEMSSRHGCKVLITFNLRSWRHVPVGTMRITVTVNGRFW